MSPVVQRRQILFDNFFGIGFQRTLRVPEDRQIYHLPKGLGQFQVRRVDDYQDKLPASWVAQGGIIIPMHFCEALYINLDGEYHNPRAVQVGVGKVNAISGKLWSDTLETGGYVVAPPQHYIDGINVGEGVIRQFVATRMGDGLSVEAQVTGKEEWGGFQIAVYAPDGDLFAARRYKTNYPQEGTLFASNLPAGMFFASGSSVTYDAGRSGAVSRGITNADAMNIGAGGKIEQKIIADPYGVDVWNLSSIQRVFVHIISATAWRELTGEWHPTPITQQAYKNAGIPWHKVYEDGLADTPASVTLQNVKSVGQKADDLGTNVSAAGETSLPSTQTPLTVDPTAVRDGHW